MMIKFLIALLISSLLAFPVEARASWTLSYETHFTDASEFNSNWTFRSGASGDPAAQSLFVSGLGNNCSVGADGLTITARKEQDGSYTSCGIYTKANWLNARIEILASVPTGQGVGPAIWMFYSGNGSLGYCEDDIEEKLGTTPNWWYLTYHHGVNASNRTQVQKVKSLTGSPTQWVYYVVEMTPETINNYYNGSLITTFNRNIVDGSLTPCQQNMHLRLQILLGGSWSGDVDDAALPAQMKVAYVKVWTGDGFIDRPGNAAFKGNPNQLLH